MTLSEAPLTGRRIAAAPISWGVCEVPGWGLQLPPERVLAEMAELDVTATELGPIGWLPLDGRAIRATLEQHGLRLVGGFVPLVLHHRDLGPTRVEAERIVRELAVAGAEVVSAAILADEDWSPPPGALDDEHWANLGRNLREVEAMVEAAGLELVLHPHAGTLVERAADIERALAETEIRWCLDTGHLVVGGVDPAAFARDHGDRVGHVHLKDVDAAVAARLRAGELTLMGAVQQGLFRPLGAGDGSIGDVLSLLDTAGYERWYVLEQDTAITGEEPPVGSGPQQQVRESLAFLAANTTTKAPHHSED